MNNDDDLPTRLAARWCPADIHTRGLDPRNLTTPPTHCQCDRLAAAVTEALEEERKAIVTYLRATLAANHPHLSDAYEHAAKNIESGAATMGGQTLEHDAPHS